MAQFGLDGIAFITGAASGIGKEIGLAFAEAGAKSVVFADVQVGAAAEAAEESKKVALNPDFQAMSVAIDVTSAASVQAAVEKAAAEFGAIDYCVNSAGVDMAAYGPFHTIAEDDYDRVLAVNAKGAFLVTQAVVKIMASQAPRSFSSKRRGTREIGRGAIVNISSALGLGAVPGKGAYIASKHALHGITRSAAMDFNKLGIRVNMVCPTFVATPMHDEEKRRVPVMPHIIESFVATGRTAETDEVAAAAQYLCSPVAAYITGSYILIDNGISIGPTFGM